MDIQDDTDTSQAIALARGRWETCLFGRDRPASADPVWIVIWSELLALQRGEKQLSLPRGQSGIINVTLGKDRIAKVWVTRRDQNTFFVELIRVVKKST